MIIDFNSTNLYYGREWDSFDSDGYYPEREESSIIPAPKLLHPEFKEISPELSQSRLDLLLANTSLDDIFSTSHFSGDWSEFSSGFLPSVSNKSITSQVHYQSLIEELDDKEFIEDNVQMPFQKKLVIERSIVKKSKNKIVFSEIDEKIIFSSYIICDIVKSCYDERQFIWIFKKIKELFGKNLNSRVTNDDKLICDQFFKRQINPSVLNKCFVKLKDNGFVLTTEESWEVIYKFYAHGHTFGKKDLKVTIEPRKQESEWILEKGRENNSEYCREKTSEIIKEIIKNQPKSKNASELKNKSKKLQVVTQRTNARQVASSQQSKEDNSQAIALLILADQAILVSDDK